MPNVLERAAGLIGADNQLVALLTGLAFTIRLNRSINPRLRQHLSTANWVIQIRSESGRVARHFAFQNGRFESKPEVHPCPDYEQVWRDPQLALTALPHPDRTRLLRANELGDVEFRGDMLAGLFFAEVLAHIEHDLKARIKRAGVRT